MKAVLQFVSSWPISLCLCPPGGVIAYISSSSSSSSPESCHSDSSNGSYQSSSPPRGSSPSCHQHGQPADPALPTSSQNLPGTQKSGRSSSTAKCGITSKSVNQLCARKMLSAHFNECRNREETVSIQVDEGSQSSRLPTIQYLESYSTLL